jgi:hypothetical protein
MIRASQKGNISATRNQLRYWSLAFAVMPQFQLLLKIQHRCGAGSRPIPVAAGDIEEAHYAGLREKFGNGFRIEMGPELNRDCEVEN